MQVTETKNEGLQREFTITLGADEIEEKVTSRIENLKNEVRIPGFRPGKVPTSLIRKRYGQAVMGEVLEAAVTDSSQKALADRELRPAMQPKIEVAEDFEPGKDLAYTLSMEILPEIKPMDFSKLEVERTVAKVEDKEVDEAINRLAEQYRQSEPIKGKRKSKKGDVVVIDFEGKVDDVPFDGGKGEGHHLHLGEGQFIPGFEDQVIGAKAGESVEVKVTFPEEYGATELAGKDAVFSVDVKEIREMVDTPIDDEFAKSLGQEDLAALRKALGDRIAQDYAGITREKVKRDLLDKLEEGHDFELPQGMVDQEFNSIWSQYEEARKNDAEGDEAVEEDKTDDELKEDYMKIARRRVMLGLLLTEVGTVNNVEVSADEISRALMQEAQKYPGQEKQVIELYQQNPQAMASLRAPLFEEKVVDFILEMAKVTEKEVSIDELLAPPETDESAKKAKPKAKKKAPAKKAKAEKEDTATGGEEES